MIKQPQLHLDLKHLTPGLGCFYVFFGMNENCPELPKKNWWLYNTDKYNFDDDVENFLKKSAQEYVESGPCLMFLSFPSQKDSDYKNRHTKGQTGVIITFANYEWFQELVPDHEQRWNETFKKDRMKRPEDYKGEFSFNFWIKMVVHLTIVFLNDRAVYSSVIVGWSSDD